MKLFAPRPKVFAAQPISNWLNAPQSNYIPVNEVSLAPMEAGAHQAFPVQNMPRPTGELGDPSLYSTPNPKTLADFPSPMSIFTKPRNVFGA